MKTLARIRRIFVAGLLVLSTADPALAEIPAHPPGAICSTPDFWCWAAVYGQIGTQCTCPTANGFVYGIYI